MRVPTRPAHLLVVGLVGALVAPTFARGQTRPLEEGETVRIRSAATGSYAVRGSVMSLDRDSLSVAVDGQTTTARFPTTILTDPSWTVERVVGNKAVQGALAGFLAAGGLGFAFGYCFQLFGEGCAKDVGGGVEGGLAFGAVGGIVGLLLGSLGREYEPVGPLPEGGRVALAPTLGPRGRIGWALRIRSGPGR